MVSSGTERAGRSVFLGLAGWIALSGAFAFGGAEFGKAGDRYALTYRPGKKPIDEDLKNELLRRG